MKLFLFCAYTPLFVTHCSFVCLGLWIFIFAAKTKKANGPLRGVVAISSGRGEVRGYVGSPMLGDMHLSEAVGKGMVQVVKNHPDWPNPYNGITAIQYGDIDRDLGKPWRYGFDVGRVIQYSRANICRNFAFWSQKVSIWQKANNDHVH